MNCLIISKDRKLDKHSGVIEFLKSRDYSICHSFDFNEKPEDFFNFYIIDEELINQFEDEEHIPFLVSIHSKSENNPIYKRDNCLGFIDLDSNPLSIDSYLHIVLQNIKHYNEKHRKESFRYNFTSFDISFFKTHPNGLVFQDKNGAILDLNPAAEDILSATKDQLTGITSLDPRWHSINEDGTNLKGEDHPAMVTLRTKKPVRDFIMGISSGVSDLKWIAVDAIPVFDSNNEIDMVYTYFRDITISKNEHENNILLSLVVNQSPISILITDTEGNIESINPRFSELTGYSKEELIGKNPRVLMSKESKTDFKKLWKTIKSGKVWVGEFYNVKKSGEPYTESAIIAPLMNEKSEITNFVAIKEDITGLKSIQKKLETTLTDLEIIVEKRTASLRSAQSLTLESLATLSEYRDNETGAHIKRTKLYVKFMLEKIKDSLDYTEEEIVQIWSSAPLHDIGKVAIPDSILLKRGKLTPEEFLIMKEHPVHGNEALMRVSELKVDDSYLKFAKEITLFHHEKWNGSGYPYGLAGNDIPLSARLMAVADVYDALRSTRPYKVGFSHETAMEMIKRDSGTHFDPYLIEIFLEFNLEFDKIYNESVEDSYNLQNL